jgi:hypothetical protein
MTLTGTTSWSGGFVRRAAQAAWWASLVSAAA